MKQKLPDKLISLAVLALIISLPVLIANLYKPTPGSSPQVAGAHTAIDETTNEVQTRLEQSLTDLNQDGQVDILDYTIATSQDVR
jgi:hypothetical protein